MTSMWLDDRGISLVCQQTALCPHNYYKANEDEYNFF